MSINLTMEGETAVIVMDDGKANAASAARMQELNAVLDEAEKSARAVVLAGRPGVFCGGFDIKAMQGGDMAARDEMVSWGAKTSFRMFKFPLPLVLAVTGHGLALGAVWLFCGDTRIGEEGDYKFGLNETAIGEVLPPFGYEPAKLALNSAHLFTATVQSRIYDPAGAKEAGFLDEVVEAGRSVEVATDIASKLGQLPTESYLGNKLAIRSAAIARILHAASPQRSATASGA